MRSPDLAARMAAPLPDRTQALRLLLEAHDTADELVGRPLDFACPLLALYAQGVTDPVLRWLCARGLVEHVCETTRCRQRRRSFRKTLNTRFTTASCFLLTAAGRVQAKQMLAHNGHSLTLHLPLAAKHPVWDAERRELRLDDRLLKHFRRHAPNQETILAAFHKAAWPPHIDDPLPNAADQDPRQRLHDTIKCLNRNLRNSSLRFHGDGTCRGLLWKFHEP